MYRLTHIVSWGVRTPHLTAPVQPLPSTLRSMVGEAVAHVRGSKGLKAAANPLRCGFLNSPIARAGDDMRTSVFLVIAASLVLPATAQHITDQPPPYDLQGATVNDILSIWTAKQTWCLSRFESKKIKSAVGTAHCIYDGFGEAMGAQYPSASDIFNTMIAKQFAIASRYDRKKITWPEVKAESAEAISQFITALQVRAAAYQQQTTEQSRTRAAQILAAQAEADQRAQVEEGRRRQQACLAAGMLQPGDLFGGAARAMAASNCNQQALQPPTAPPPMSKNTNCQIYGNQVFCTTQ